MDSINLLIIFLKYYLLIINILTFRDPTRQHLHIGQVQPQLVRQMGSYQSPKSWSQFQFLRQGLIPLLFGQQLLNFQAQPYPVEFERLGTKKHRLLYQIWPIDPSFKQPYLLCHLSFPRLASFARLPLGLLQAFEQQPLEQLGLALEQQVYQSRWRSLRCSDLYLFSQLVLALPFQELLALGPQLGQI